MLLHNPEFQTKGGATMDQVYERMQRAFAALEEEVAPSPATHAILAQLKAGECIRHSI